MPKFQLLAPFTEVANQYMQAARAGDQRRMDELYQAGMRNAAAIKEALGMQEAKQRMGIAAGAEKRAGELFKPQLTQEKTAAERGTFELGQEQTKAREDRERSEKAAAMLGADPKLLAIIVGAKELTSQGMSIEEAIAKSVERQKTGAVKTEVGAESAEAAQREAQAKLGTAEAGALLKGGFPGMSAESKIALTRLAPTQANKELEMLEAQIRTEAATLEPRIKILNAQAKLYEAQANKADQPGAADYRAQAAFYELQDKMLLNKWAMENYGVPVEVLKLQRTLEGPQMGDEDILGFWFRLIQERSRVKDVINNPQFAQFFADSGVDPETMKAIAGKLDDAIQTLQGRSDVILKGIITPKSTMPGLPAPGSAGGGTPGSLREEVRDILFGGKTPTQEAEK